VASLSEAKKKSPNESEEFENNTLRGEWVPKMGEGIYQNKGGLQEKNFANQARC